MIITVGLPFLRDKLAVVCVVRIGIRSVMAGGGPTDLFEFSIQLLDVLALLSNLLLVGLECLYRDNMVACEKLYKQKNIFRVTFFRDLLFLFLSESLSSVGLLSGLRYFGGVASFSLSEVSGIGEFGIMTVIVIETKGIRVLYNINMRKWSDGIARKRMLCERHHNVLKQVNEFPIRVNDAPGLQINLNGSLSKR